MPRYLVAGARPNVMKIAPIVRALRADGRLAFKLVHTGQHSERVMSAVFFDQVGIAPPDLVLGDVDSTLACALAARKPGIRVAHVEAGLRSGDRSMPPCITLRDNTERPLTVDQGTNVLAGTDPAVIVPEARKVLAGFGKRGWRPQLWDGKAAGRIVEILARELI